MRKQFINLLLFCLCLSGVSFSQSTRAAVFAGQFYDNRPSVLHNQIDTFLRQAEKRDLKNGTLLALIVPHAGYSCSGSVAATAYKQVEGLDLETVVIVGTSHQGKVIGCSIFPEGGYETPLGVVPVDQRLAQKISEDSGFGYSPSAHLVEHSIEVQVPFLQKVLPNAKIVPILMGPPNADVVHTLADSLSRILRGTKSLVVISTDLSHYYPRKKANAIDTQTITHLQDFDAETLMKKLQGGDNIMCGGAGVVAALLYARNSGPAAFDLLQYTDSSVTCGSPAEVVGYLAGAISAEVLQQEEFLREEEKEELLWLARMSIENFLKKKKGAEYSPKSSRLLLERGAFVTLKKDGALRGCIGYANPVAPLYQTIIQAAIYASVKDARFKPVTAEEVDGLTIEISVLTPLQKIGNPLRIDVGKHGLFISKGIHSALLLPQVPVENHWTRLTFLEQICLKAGLPKNAWASGAELYIFEALVFHE